MKTAVALVIAQLGEQGQQQGLGAGPLGLRKVARRQRQVTQRGLEVRGRGTVDDGLYTLARQ